MSILFLLPDHLVDPAKILSCTDEQGLKIDVPVSASTNKGSLRLRSSGTPTSVVSYDIALVGGGNPMGYSSNDNFYGSGASALWKKQADGAAQWRGYTDTIYLTKVEMPFAIGGVFLQPPSHPRQLPDGTLGLLYPNGANTWTFARYSHAGVVTTGTITAPNNYGRQPDFVVLPSGRLVAFTNRNTVMTSWFSDDQGLTWAYLGKTMGFAAGLEVLQAEYVPQTDMIVAVVADYAALVDTEVWISRDGGVEFTKVADTGLLQQGGATCVTPDGTVLFATPALGAAGFINVYAITPGGGFGSPVQTTVAAAPAVWQAAPGIVCRDDGTIWVFGMNQDATSISMQCSVSRDGGQTWEDPANSHYVFDTDFAAATNGYSYTTFGVWDGAVVGIGFSAASVGSSGFQHLLTFGGWDDINDVKRDLVTTMDGLPYEHVYMPIDYPDSMGWTRADVAAGATVTNTNPGHLHIVGTVANNSQYTSGATFWTGAAADTRRIRFRARVNNGGDLLSDVTRVYWAITDGVNEQAVTIRMQSGGFRVLDGPGNTLANIITPMTAWMEFLVAYSHDYPAAGAGQVSVWYRGIGVTFWTAAVLNAVVAEQVGVNNSLIFGGSVAGFICDWDLSFLGVADDDNELNANAAVLNPAYLAPRSLTSAVDCQLSDGVRLGAFNGVGFPGDDYTLATTYSFGRSNLWRELRPSRQLRSSVANAQWDIIFDAGANNVWHADSIAIIGSNFRATTFYMANNLPFVFPALTQALDPLYASGAGGTGSVGMFVPAIDPKWRKAQLKSVPNRRWFFRDSAGTTFEVLGNDSDRLYLSGTPANGAWSVFGDRMGATFAATHERYARLRVTAQLTADGQYRLGLPLMAMKNTLEIPYAHNFTDRTEPTIVIHESSAGYRSGALIGPRRSSLSIQWTPINRLQTSQALQIEDLYNSLAGSMTPVVFWRDSTDQTTIQLVRVVGTYSRPNERGEGSTGLAGIDQLVLEEEF